MDQDDAEFLRDRVRSQAEGVFGPLELARFERMTGGHSGMTWEVELVLAGGARQRLVLKSAPHGRPAIGRHDVLRQAQAMSALANVPGLVVPRVLFVHETEPRFYAVAWVDGEAVEPIFEMPATHVEAVRGRYAAAAEMLAALHRFHPAQLAGSNEPYRVPLAELEHWVPAMEAGDVGVEVRAEARLLQRRLRERAPDGDRPALLHGDYRLGNVIFMGAEPAAVVDWEIWSIGDPRVDLGWLAVFSEPALFPGFSGLNDVPRPDEIVATYRRAAPESAEMHEWFHALARYKLAAVLAHNLKRHRTGRYQDPEQERMAPAIGPLVRSALERLG